MGISLVSRLKKAKVTSIRVDMGNPGQSGGEMKKGEVYYETS